MARYIDADKLRKDEIARCGCVPLVGSGYNDYKDLDEVLNDAPTANVAPMEEVERLRAENEKWRNDWERNQSQWEEAYEKLEVENERLRGIGVPDNKAYIKLSEAKTAIMNYAGEQTVSKYATSELCKAVRNGAEGAMNELDYLPTYNVAPIADTVRKMQDKLDKHFCHDPAFLGVEQRLIMDIIDRIAKEMFEGIQND